MEVLWKDQEVAYIAPTYIHVAKPSHMVTPSFKGELGSVDLSWQPHISYNSIAMEEAKNGFDRITSSFYHMYNLSNITPIQDGSKEKCQDNFEGTSENTPLTDQNCESGHRATSPDGNKRAAKAPGGLPKKIMKPREYLYLNALTEDFVDELITGM